MNDSTKRMYKLGQGTYTVKLSFPDIGANGIEYNTDVFEKDKFALTEALMNGDSLEFVGCISNCLQAQIHGASADLEGQKVIATMDIVGQNDPVDLFVGYVKSAKTRSDLAYKEITCYDSLWKKVADKDVSSWYNDASFPMTMKQLRDSFFTFVGITQETTTLCNDNIEISQEYDQVERMCGLDVLKSICQFNAVCGIMGRDDKFKYVMPDSISTQNDEENFFYHNMQYEEYVTNKITKVEVRDDEDAEAVYYGSGKNKYIIQGNMFIYGLKDDVKKTICKNILNQIKNFQYRPVSYEACGLPFVEVGTTQQFQVLDWLNGQGQRVTRKFPMLNRTLEGIQELTDRVNIRGKREQTEFITDIRAQIEALKRTTEELMNSSSRIVDYIPPTDLDEANIASGSNNDILTFEFYNSADGEKSSFYSEVNYSIATVVDTANDIYGDATLTVRFILDGTTLATMTETYGDCDRMLFLNYLMVELARGNHTFKVNFAMSNGNLSGMHITSSYLLAASVVEDGNYDEEYDIYDDPEFAEEMEELGSEAVGEYIQLKPPNDGQGSFSGDQFCDDWLAAFVRPFEYMQIVEAKAGKQGTWYPNTDDDTDWTSSPPAMANGFYTNDNNVIKLIPEYLDEELEGMSLHKHINLWFVSVSYFNNNIQTSRDFKVFGGYVASGGFRCTGNYPTQGFMTCSLENTGGASWNLSQYAISHQLDAYQRWLNGSGTYYKSNFILVYNVDAFKDYLERLDFNNAISLASSYFLLAECNIKKEKESSGGTTDWSDNDDYHGE